MVTCLIVQPIHPAGLEALAAAGIETKMASGADMATVAREIADCEAVITRNAGLDGAAIEAGRRLCVIASHGAGTNKVDLDRAGELGIPVVYTPGANARSVAEHAIMLALAVAKRVTSHDAAVCQGDWNCRYEPGLQQLHGKVLGISGFGMIGQLTAAIATHGFGMNVLVHSPSVPQGDIRAAGYEPCDLETLLRESDVLSLHRPARADTRRMIDAAALTRMKPSAILVNTARGDLVDMSALAEALAAGRIAGAGLDVFDPEPLEPGHPLLSSNRVVRTPHTGGSTDEALRETALQCADQIIEVLAGRRPANLVRPGIWERRRTAA